MEGGTFTHVDQGAKTELYIKLEEAKKRVEELEEEYDISKELVDIYGDTGYDSSGGDGDGDGDAPNTVYAEPVTLNAYGTWENSQEYGDIALSFSSHGGSVTGSFSNCMLGDCWSSKASGTFNGVDGGTVSGSISGSGSGSSTSLDGTVNSVSYTISGSFSGTVYLSRDFAEGTFTTNVYARGNNYPDSGTWIVSF